MLNIINNVPLWVDSIIEATQSNIECRHDVDYISCFEFIECTLCCLEIYTSIMIFLTKLLLKCFV